MSTFFGSWPFRAKSTTAQFSLEPHLYCLTRLFAWFANISARESIFSKFTPGGTKEYFKGKNLKSLVKDFLLKARGVEIFFIERTGKTLELGH